MGIRYSSVSMFLKLSAVLLLVGMAQTVQATTFSDNFDDGDAIGWIGAAPSPGRPAGNWRVESQEVKQDLPGDHFKFLLGNRMFADQTIQTKLISFQVAGYGGITLWYQDANNWVDVYIYPSGTESLWILEVVGGIALEYRYKLDSNRSTWYLLKVNADSSTGKLAVYVDDTYLLTHTTTTPHRFGFSGLKSGNSGGLFDDFLLVTTDQTQCEADLETARNALNQCMEDRDQFQEELNQCLQNPPLKDNDHDGEFDQTDSCPDTAEGVKVDEAGCSLEQFCSEVNVNSKQGRSICSRSDWKNDEPTSFSPSDCEAKKHGSSQSKYYTCEPL